MLLSVKSLARMSRDEPRMNSKWRLNARSNLDRDSSVGPTIRCPIIIESNNVMKNMMMKCRRSRLERDNVRTVKSRCLWKSTNFSERAIITRSDMPVTQK